MGRGFILKISVCIPVFIKDDFDFIFFKNCLNSIKIQTFEDYEIIISTNKKGNATLLTEFFQEHLEYYSPLFLSKIKVYYIKTNNAIKNWNNCLKNATGDFVTLLHQDDWYLNENVFQYWLNFVYNESKNWLMTSCTNFSIIKQNEFQFHTQFVNTVKPVDSTTIIDFRQNCVNGINRYGNPSTIFYQNMKQMYDESLQNLVDLDFYLQLYQIFGKPYIYTYEPLIGIGLHDSQISSTMTEEIQRKEIKYLHKKWK